ncbi:protein ACCELERATED CELL DEATH 6-like isoform X2 [Euphorbia lathyris]|uniref:protein ACCELERATED CELL DEATH 6-like isoform X2 n=1 Tax=Euphorbia lathyris TaxID=212925 RepID=UPI0033142616
MDLKINVDGEEMATMATTMRLDNDDDIQDEFVHLELYEAARKCTPGQFQQVLQKVSEERNESASTIIHRVRLLGNSLLHAAVSAGNEDVAAFVAQNFSSLIIHANRKGDTALHIAARCGMLSLVRILARHDEGLLRMENVYGNTSLHEAVSNRHVSVVEYFLVEKHMEPNCNKNNEGWYPIDIAIKNDDMQMLGILLQKIRRQCANLQELQANPPAHIAIWEGRIELMAEKYKEFVQLRDERGRTPLNWAATIGDINAVHILLSHSIQSWFQTDHEGYLPIHRASANGHVKAIIELLKLEHCPDPTDLLTEFGGENILHIAAKWGKENVVKYILGNPKMEKLLNEKDLDGNTPLHLAAKHSHPAVSLTLTWDRRIQLNQHNNQGLTPLDLVVRFEADQLALGRLLLQHTLTTRALLLGGCKTTRDPEITNKSSEEEMKMEFDEKKPQKVEWIKDSVGPLLTVATIVATGTFTAGFTVPGGNNDCDSPDRGMPILLDSFMFQLFVITNSSAFYCSIICILFCLFTKYGDVVVAKNAYLLSVRSFGVALTMMAVAFYVAVQLSDRKVPWLYSFTFITGTIFLIFVALGLVADVPPRCSQNPFGRYIGYYMVRLPIFLFL